MADDGRVVAEAPAQRRATVTPALRRLFTTGDALDLGQFLVARYRIRAGTDQDLRVAAAHLALLTYFGTVDPLPYESVAARLASGPRVINAAHDAGDGSGDVTIALPTDIFAGKDVVTQILNVLLFSAEYNYVSEIKLISIDLPTSLISSIDGPGFGAAGIRDRFEVERRPIIAAILKPRAGVRLGVLREQAHEALLGGADVVLDDELMVNPDGDLSLENRARALVDAARDATATTREKKSVVVNVTARPSHAVQYAEMVAAIGVDGVLFNSFAAGLPALQDLAGGGVGVPVFACPVGSGVVTRASGSTGIDSAVYSRLNRLAGADAVQTGILAGSAYTREAWGPAVIALERPIGQIRTTLPIVAGGLNITNLWPNWNSVGDDVIVAAGHGILAFPGGPRSGAKAFRAVLKQLTLEMSGGQAAEALVDAASRRGGAELKAGLEFFGFDRDRYRTIE